MATKSKELNIEDKLWKAADALRGSMDASEYRNVVLGLIFLSMRRIPLMKEDKSFQKQNILKMQKIQTCI